MAELVSIVIPVYNGENTIKGTVESIMRQDYQHIEIIIINDGSTDKTESVLKRIAETDSRIIIIEQKNAGVSEARNRGIQKATGKYVCFVDADDRIHKTMVSKLVNTAERFEVELVMCGFCVELGSQEIEYTYGNKLLRSSEEIHKNFVSIVNARMINVVWNKLIRRDFLIQNELFFKAYSSGEDTIFNVDVFEKLSSVAFLKDVLYFYNQASFGTLTTEFHANKFNALLEYNLRLHRMYIKWGLMTKDTENALDFMLFRSILSSYLSLANSNTHLSFKKKRRWILDMLELEAVQTMAHRLRTKKMLYKCIIFIIRSQNGLINYWIAKSLFLVNKYFPMLIERGKTGGR